MRSLMSIKGSPYTWLRGALERGDLLTAWASAQELRQLSLEDALALVILMARDQDEAFDRASAKWLARLALERPTVHLDNLHHGVHALETIPRDTSAGRTQLSELCDRHDITRVIGLND